MLPNGLHSEAHDEVAGSISFSVVADEAQGQGQASAPIRPPVWRERWDAMRAKIEQAPSGGAFDALSSLEDLRADAGGAPLCTLAWSAQIGSQWTQIEHADLPGRLPLDKADVFRCLRELDLPPRTTYRATVFVANDLNNGGGDHFKVEFMLPVSVRKAAVAPAPKQADALAELLQKIAEGQAALQERLARLEGQPASDSLADKLLPVLVDRVLNPPVPATSPVLERALELALTREPPPPPPQQNGLQDLLASIDLVQKVGGFNWQNRLGNAAANLLESGGNAVIPAVTTAWMGAGAPAPAAAPPVRPVPKAQATAPAPKAAQPDALAGVPPQLQQIGMQLIAQAQQYGVTLDEFAGNADSLFKAIHARKQELAKASATPDPEAPHAPEEPTSAVESPKVARKAKGAK